jgi:hypothetical protein
MKARNILGMALAILCTTAHGQQVEENYATYFTARLHGDKTSYNHSHKLSWKSVKAYRAQIWETWCEANSQFEEDKLPALRPLTNADTLLWPLPAELEPNATMPYYYGTKGEKPHNGWPLYLYIHGSGPKTHEWATGYILCSRFMDAPSLYFIPQIPNEGSYYRWWQRAKQYAWERLLRQAFVSGEVDANRVYLFGISEGGYGSQRLASFYADYLAAAGPMAGGEIPFDAPAENCGHIGFSLRTGANDYMFARNLLTARTHELFDSLQRCYPMEYRHHVELIPGRGHGIDYSPTTPWLSHFTRTVHPRHFVWEDYPMDGIYRQGFYNIAIHERDTTGGNERTRYEMTIMGNTILLTIDRVDYEVTQREPRWNIPIKHIKHYKPARKGAFTLYLSDEMVDFDQKVSLIVNGKQVYHGMVYPNTKHLINSCATFFDPERVYAAGIEVRW